MKITTRNIILVALFAGLTAVGGFISIPIGPVPITLQTLFVIIGGILLGPKLGALSQVVYILLGLAGLPIFAGFTGGPQVIFKPSFGFLVGFVFAAYVVGRIVEANSYPYLGTQQFTVHTHIWAHGSSQFKIWIASIAGTIVIYLCGLPYMYYILNIVMVKNFSLQAILNMGLILFLPGDIIKLIVASIVGIKLKPILKRME